MKLKLIFAAVAAAITTWAPITSARESVALPYIFGVAPGDSVGQATGVDTTGAGLLTVNPNININTLNDVGGGITSNINNVASILFTGNSTITGFTGTNLIRFIDITAGANATTVNFNGDVFTTAFNLSGTGTVNFNGNVNQGIVAASSNFAGDGFINIGANKLFNSAITTNTANTGTLTLNGGSGVIGAIGGANGLKRINVVGGNVSVTGAIQARQFDLNTNTLTMIGALTTNVAGIINTTFASDAVFGKIVVNGNSAINAAGVTVIPTVTGALTNGTTYRIVEAPSGTNNAAVSVINNNPRYTFAGLPTSLGSVDIVLAGVAPLANICHAIMLLQICTPLSFTIQVFTTLLPLAFNTSAILHPKKLFLKWPKCNGLLVLGEEYSTMIVLSFFVAIPNSALLCCSFIKLNQKASVTSIFKNPFIILNEENKEALFFNKYSPNSFPKTSGDFFNCFTKENSTIV